MSSTAAYDPSSNSWSALPSLTTARCAHQAVSTGTGILTFGGLSDCSNGTTIGPGLEHYTPSGASGTWTTVNDAGEPEHRYNFSMTWTGSSMFVFGGGTNTHPAVASGAIFSTTDMTWTGASCALTECDRGNALAFVDGNTVRLWGGIYDSNYPNPQSGNLLSAGGLAYDLVGGTWSAWTVPDGTAAHLAGSFADDGRRIYFLTAANVVSIYDRKTSAWLANDTAAMPSGFCVEAAAAWTGSELIAWSGSCGSGVVNVGGRYQPPAPT